MMNGNWGFMGFGWLFWLIIFLLILWIVARVIVSKRYREGSPPPAGEESALQILKRRYANGEISKAQYEEMKRDLEK